MLSAMEKSRFCLVVTGDAMSTRRLSEIFMAGMACLHVMASQPCLAAGAQTNMICQGSIVCLNPVRLCV